MHAALDVYGRVKCGSALDAALGAERRPGRNGQGKRARRLGLLRRRDVRLSNGIWIELFRKYWSLLLLLSSLLPALLSACPIQVSVLQISCGNLVRRRAIRLGRLMEFGS